MLAYHEITWYNKSIKNGGKTMNRLDIRIARNCINALRKIDDIDYNDTLSYYDLIDANYDKCFELLTAPWSLSNKYNSKNNIYVDIGFKFFSGQYPLAHEVNDYGDDLDRIVERIHLYTIDGNENKRVVAIGGDVIRNHKHYTKDEAISRFKDLLEKYNPKKEIMFYGDAKNENLEMIKNTYDSVTKTVMVKR